MLLTFFVFIILTLIFIISIGYIKTEGKHPGSGHKSEGYFDGNGVSQWKGRGHRKDDVEVLLQRIDWLAKHGDDKNNYTIAYILAYLTTIGVFLVLYGYSGFYPTCWELLVVALTSYLIIFSIDNLLNFHTHRYPYYYIRNNVGIIQDKMNYFKGSPPNPDKNTSVPHRTVIRDVIER